MSAREEIEQAVQGLIDTGSVQDSAQTATNQVTVTIRGVELDADDGGNEQRSAQPLYGNGGVLVRPAAESDGVSMEVVFVRSGDDMMPIAARETRWSVELEEGEVVVRALSDDGGRIRMKPNGDVIVETGGTIKLGSEDASEGASLGSALKSWLDGHTHAYIDTVFSGTGTSTPTPSLSTPPTGAANAAISAGLPADESPDPSTKVLVE